MIFNQQKIHVEGVGGSVRRTLILATLAAGLAAGTAASLLAACTVPCSCAAVQLAPFGSYIYSDCTVNGEPTQCLLTSTVTSGQTQCELSAAGTDCTSTDNIAYAYTVTTTNYVGCAEDLSTGADYCDTQEISTSEEYGVPNDETISCN